MENYPCSPLKLMICIVNRDEGDKVSAFLRQHNILYSIIFLGIGTCDSKWINLLGLADVDKDIVFSLGEEEQIQHAMAGLDEYMNLSLPGRGIAFSIPLKTIDRCSLNHLLKLQNEVEG